jgi:hypothetical protein
MAPRTIIIGDVHGCREEAEELLDRVGPTADDRLVFAGDLVARGPDSLGVLELVRRIGALAIRGNHEDRILAWNRAQKNGTVPPLLGRSHIDLVGRLAESDWDLMASWPLWLDFEVQGLRVVHAGVVPGIPIEAQADRSLLTMRYLGPNNEPIEKGGNILWGTRYSGPPHVVFGHNARPEPQIHPFATGIDTAAVYGERLTAFVLPDDAEVPPPSDRRDLLVSVPAKRRYYEPR